MARIRSIKPEYWTDEKTGKLKLQERLLFIGLWNIADDQGCLKSGTGYIKGQLFPYDEELRIDTVKSWLTSLINARLIVPFTFKGEGYYFIRTFEDHQVINRPGKPKFPKELLISLKGAEETPINEDSLNTHGVITEDSLQEIGNRKGNRKGEDSPPTPPSEEAYPKEVQDSFKKFQGWIADNAPNVAKMKEPFTIDQYVKLTKRGMDGAEITRLLAAMHNYKPLLTKNLSAYLTLIKWSEKQ